MKSLRSVAVLAALSSAAAARSGTLHRNEISPLYGDNDVVFVVDPSTGISPEEAEAAIAGLSAPTQPPESRQARRARERHERKHPKAYRTPRVLR